MAIKTLLVALTTVRNGERKRFASGTVVDLTKEELANLDALTLTTGKAHYRDPIREGGPDLDADDGDDGGIPGLNEDDYVGASVAMDEKTVDQLKAYLDFHQIAFDEKAKKADLLAAATAHGADPDAGL